MLVGKPAGMKKKINKEREREKRNRDFPLAEYAIIHHRAR